MSCGNVKESVLVFCKEVALLQLRTMPRNMSEHNFILRFRLLLQIRTMSRNMSENNFILRFRPLLQLSTMSRKMSEQYFHFTIQSTVADKNTVKEIV